MQIEILGFGNRFCPDLEQPDLRSLEEPPLQMASETILGQYRDSLCLFVSFDLEAWSSPICRECNPDFEFAVNLTQTVDPLF